MLVRPPFRSTVGFPINAVNFDGTNDFTRLSTDLTGNAESKVMIISFWFDLQGGDPGSMSIYAVTGIRMAIFRTTSLRWRIQGLDTTGVSVVRMDTAQLYSTTFNPGRHHLLATWDTAAAPADRMALYIDGVPNLIITDNNDDLIDWTRNSHQIGASATSADKLNANIGQLYINNEASLTRTGLGQTINSTDLKKFYRAGDHPVDLGVDGSIPTGAVPRMFFDGNTSTWHRNEGDGGTFTLTGTLTTAADAPWS